MKKPAELPRRVEGFELNLKRVTQTDGVHAGAELVAGGGATV